MQIQQLATGEAPATVCGTQINGGLTVQNNASPIAIGSYKPGTCAGNTVGGDLQVHNNTGSIDSNNLVDGNLQVNTGRTGAVQL